MELQIKESVWKGQLDRMVDLVGLGGMASTLHNVSSAQQQTKQPEQLIIRFLDGSTMLIFKSGKFRIMGGKIDDLDSHFNIFSISTLYNEIPNIVLQTMTAAYAYPYKINLGELANNIESSYSAEIFPAVHIRKYKPISVNVFASGKVVICGLKDFSTAQRIEEELDWLLCCIILRRNLL